MSPPRGLRDRYVSRNVNRLHDEAMSFGDRLADDLARLVGSWTFVVAFTGVLLLWIGLNSLQLLVGPLDPYPYLFLNLVLSCLAAIQPPIILMSQNRQAARDRLFAEQEYACDAKTEIALEQLHEELDQLRETQWLDLISLQQQQIALLHQLLECCGVVPTTTGHGVASASALPVATPRNAAPRASAPPAETPTKQADRRRAGRRQMVRTDATTGAGMAEDASR